MLKVSYHPEHGIVNIKCDAKGMATLLASLANLVGERASHVHLRSPSAGGNELDEGSTYGKTKVTELLIDYAESD